MSATPALLLSLSLSWVGGSRSVAAASPEAAPASLVEALAEIETAANEQDIDVVLAAYSEEFQGPDGFTRSQYQLALEEFWSQYISLTYTIELLSWDSEGATTVAETLTTVTGQQRQGNRTLTLLSEVRSRQEFTAGQIVSQEILSEQSTLKSGPNPPEVTIQLPESVSPGERFAFDAIVQQPLGDSILLGHALDEGATAEDFLTPRPIMLEQLTAGGLFKVGEAPENADNRWISSLLIREDGITINTHRLQVE